MNSVKATIIEKIDAVYENTAMESTVPVDIYTMARRLGFAIQEFNRLPANVMGIMFLEMDKKLEKAVGSDKLIGLNSVFSDKHKRFTIAHELGHFMLHYDDCKSGDNIVYCMVEDDEHGMEGEANKFAAFILVDEDTFKYECDKYPREELRTKKILGSLSDTFNVPVSTIRRRLEEVGL